MRISELIAQHIINKLNSENGIAEIQRNELAQLVGCVPSQITYVITSQFTPEHGYKVESRRGGGGCIKITKISMNVDTAIMHIVNSIGNSIDKASAIITITNMVGRNIISEEIGNLMLAAISERVFSEVPASCKETLRAAILKNMLLAIF